METTSTYTATETRARAWFDAWHDARLQERLANRGVETGPRAYMGDEERAAEREYHARMDAAAWADSQDWDGICVSCRHDWIQSRGDCTCLHCNAEAQARQRDQIG